ncbi:Spermidine Putrescine ABC transporter permease component PotB [Candidatus Rhodobacter oscarellae]|uniref:Spermidine Putrescine ABC transporter permease component PotB n=1 Tax=Candidatus Rhodobacter oscarellae TaxID=1675527 RepID=A0A0J9H3M6_9RHOB|nr:ABC transporter permease [Candidatus Rhodobacter lobularis]KMW60278.1 Spermidine Putrescine ABC transporter permease component PotB [Candidatus Rhodobacter lobularis]
MQGTEESKRLWLLAMPGLTFFLVFFLVPLGALFLISFDKSSTGIVDIRWMFDFSNYERFFTRSIYYEAALRSVGLAALVAVIALLLGYPLAYVIAKTTDPARNTFLMILVLSAMQLDMVIRLFGLMVLLGDNGLINQVLQSAGWDRVPLMYNFFGVVVGLVQFALPFMILSLVGVIQGINPSLEEAARSLGASRWRAFWKVTVPMSMPGILAGLLLVFALAISSYVVPTLMGGWKVIVLPIHIFQQISELAKWQFGASVAVIMFLISITAMLVYQRTSNRLAGGRV